MKRETTSNRESLTPIRNRGLFLQQYWKTEIEFDDNDSIKWVEDQVTVNDGVSVKVYETGDDKIYKISDCFKKYTKYYSSARFGTEETMR